MRARSTIRYVILALIFVIAAGSLIGDAKGQPTGDPSFFEPGAAYFAGPWVRVNHDLFVYDSLVVADNVLIEDNLTVEDKLTVGDTLAVGKLITVEQGVAFTAFDTVSAGGTSVLTLSHYLNVCLNDSSQIDSFDTASTLPDGGLILLEFLLADTGSVGLDDGKNLKLSGDLDYTADDIIVLQRRGDYLVEISRSVN